MGDKGQDDTLLCCHASSMVAKRGLVGSSGGGCAVVGNERRGRAGGPCLQQHCLAGARQAVRRGLLELWQHAAVVRRWRNPAHACTSICHFNIHDPCNCAAW